MDSRRKLVIPFNRPPFVEESVRHVIAAIHSDKLSGDSQYGMQCHKWFERRLGCQKALLTPSCTHALEMAALLLDLESGDEVIMPSYTFVSTANAFALRRARVVFVDIRPDTMNLDPDLIEAAITPRTKAIVPVHYAGVGCEMDAIMEIARRHNLVVIEDAAQGMMASYKGRQLGTIGHMAAYSFHETKNFTSGGEGGLLIINDRQYCGRAEVLREKGTNRSQFFRGMVDKYSWIDIGSSYLPSELQAAYLWGQLECAEEITTRRVAAWKYYRNSLQSLAEAGQIELPTVPGHCSHNGHMFYIKVASLEERTSILAFLQNLGVNAVFHYVPLHSSLGGRKFSRFNGLDRYTTLESNRLIRLPLWHGITKEVQDRVVESVTAYYR